MLRKDVVGRSGVEDPEGSVERRMGAEGEGEIVFTQERLEGRVLTREELKCHRCPWGTNQRAKAKLCKQSRLCCCCIVMLFCLYLVHVQVTSHSGLGVEQDYSLTLEIC